MCGIAGCIGPEIDRRSLASVRRATATLAHRGPDDAGFLCYDPRHGTIELIDAAGQPTPSPGAAAPASTSGVVLGHRRLAIIDPTPGGHQPMATPDGRTVLILNGEIYNYRELRRELEARGIAFRSRSDTEVLLHAWSTWGPACLPRLVGMFAFVVLDLPSRRVVLARDPFGMKPLYHARTPGGVAFASEIATLTTLAGTTHRVDPQRLYEYLDLGLTDHGDGTLFADVRALPAAHWAEVPLDGPAELRLHRYWQPDLTARATLSFEAAAARVRDLFLESVALHLRADTRVGTLLSGGIDSSAIVMAMRAVAGRSLDLHTFSYIGDAGAINEAPWIEAINSAAGTIPHTLTLRADEWGAEFPALLDVQGEPFGSIAVYAQHRLYRLAHEAGVRVILNGQGADELLAGYRATWSARIASLLKQGEWGAAFRFAHRAARPRHPLDPGRGGTVWRGIGLALPRRWGESAQRVFARPHRRWIDARWCRRHGVALRPPWWAGSGSPAVVRELLWRAVSEGSLPALLRYEDRNSMAYSVEARLPFLTTALAELVLALPENYLVGADGTNKAVFRAAMRGVVPDVVLDRREKVGFSVPMRQWIPRTPGLAALLAAAGRIPALHAGRLRTLQSRAAGRRHHPFWVWQLASLALWVERTGATFD